MDTGALNTVWDLVAKIAAFIKSWPKIVKISVSLLMILAVLISGFLWGVRSATKPVHLGGVKLDSYCGYYKLAVKNLKLCASQIDLDQVCRVEKGVPDAVNKFKSSDLNSGICYSADGKKSLGGIRDMPGHCRKTLDLETAYATPSGGVWECQIPIDPPVACNLQYNRTDTEAHLEHGTIQCYG
ncbi:hypothetical protein [Nonomuraea sp. NPDC049758]|uniref:hypothetical protein n=1 Tax=Nonomuraea sp. NPDC049758 TaxID=3154360 RepID=UPI00342D039E